MRSKKRLLCQDTTGKDVHILLRPARNALFLRLSAISLLRRHLSQKATQRTVIWQLVWVFSARLFKWSEKHISTVCRQRHICFHFSTLLPVWHKRLKVSQNSPRCWSLGRVEFQTSLYDWANSLYTTETQMKQDPQKKKKSSFWGSKWSTPWITLRCRGSSHKSGDEKHSTAEGQL